MKNEKNGHATIINAEEGPHLTVVGINETNIRPADYLFTRWYYISPRNQLKHIFIPTPRSYQLKTI